MDLQKYKDQTNCEEIKNWIDTVVRSIIIKGFENVGEIEHCIDYLNNKAKKCEKRDKLFRLKKASYNSVVEKSKEWVEKMNKKGVNIVETNDDVTHIMDLGDGLRLVRLESDNAFKREGKLMSHCVASYFDRKSYSVYSIRDSKNMPHCTLGVNKSGKCRFDQVKGKGNGKIHSKYIGAVLKVFSHFKIDIKSNEMEYLGYRKISDEIFKLYVNSFVDLKYVSYKGKVYLYNDQKFVRK